MSDIRPFPHRQRARRASKTRSPSGERSGIVRRGHQAGLREAPFGERDRDRNLGDRGRGPERSATPRAPRQDRSNSGRSRARSSSSRIHCCRSNSCASVVLRSCGWDLIRCDTSAGVRYDFLRAINH